MNNCSHPIQTRTRWGRLRSILILVVLLTSACSSAIEIEPQIHEIGSTDPHLTVANFFNDLNRALQDPELNKPEVRRTWAETLANYFTPSERIAQRDVFLLMLSDFSRSLEAARKDEQREDGTRDRLLLEISFTATEVITQTDDRAWVRLAESSIHLRRVREHPNLHQQIVSESQRPFREVFRKPGSLEAVEAVEIPVLNVNGRWYLTEGFW